MPTDSNGVAGPSRRGRRRAGALAALLAAVALSGCGDPAESAVNEPLDLREEGDAARRAALAAAVRDDHRELRRARRLGVTECRPDPGSGSGEVFCYVEFTSYRGGLMRFCTRTYETTRAGREATVAEGWPLTCLRYASRKAAREARSDRLTRRQARRQGARGAEERAAAAS